MRQNRHRRPRGSGPIKLSGARIGYGGYSHDFTAPGDRRRFAAYARLKNASFEFADVNRPYDLAYITYSSDLAGWVARKRREGDRLKLVFELIDAYFTETGLKRRLAKGIARAVLGPESWPSLDFRRTLIAACEAADAVVCSTEEQRQTILRYNPNVIASFDYFDEEICSPKDDYARGGKLRIAWEGQSTTLPNLQVIREPLNDLKERVELHVVTDPFIHRYFGRFSAYPSMDALSGIECRKVFHAWDRTSFAREITACDLAVIPIDRRNALWWGKPENKLILLWRLGMPVLTTATPVYQRVMTRAGCDMSCDDVAEWSGQIERFITAGPSKLELVGSGCRRFAEAAYSKDEFLRRFDQLFESIGVSAC